MRVRLRAPGASALALIAFTLTLTVVCTSSEAAPRAFFGIAKGAQPMDGRDFKKMRSAGVGSFRFGINWRATEPRRGAYEWSRADHVVGAAAARGIRPVPTVMGSPTWVATKSSRPPVGTRAKLKAWRTFLASAVRRYGRGGTYWRNGYRQRYPGEKPRPITAWQIWNEPNLRKYFAAKRPVRAYATVVRAAHRAITRVDRDAKIVLAGMPGTTQPPAWAFLDRLYRMKRIRRSFDAAALHPYAITIHDFRTELRRTRRVMNRHHDRRAGLWLTELGWGSARHQRSRPLNKGKRGQRRMLQRSFRLALHHRRRWRIQSLYWFDFRDPPKGTGGCTFCDSAGLLKHSRKPKPAFRAFKRIAR